MSLVAPPRLNLISINTHQPGFDEYIGWRTWCLHLFDYPGELRIADRVYPIRPGVISFTPGRVTFSHRWVQPDSRHLTAHFTPTPGDDMVELFPSWMDLGDRFPRVWRALEEAIPWFGTQPQRAEARLWDILFDLGSGPLSGDDSPVRVHDALQRAMKIIEVSLSDRINVRRLAEDVGISHNHLIRLFQERFGTTIVGYIRQRRAERAIHLLRNTTLPIKTIAHQVGVTDGQQFNKMMRKATGMSPTAVRTHR